MNGRENKNTRLHSRGRANKGTSSSSSSSLSSSSTRKRLGLVLPLLALWMGVRLHVYLTSGDDELFLGQISTARAVGSKSSDYYSSSMVLSSSSSTTTTTTTTKATTTQEAPHRLWRVWKRRLLHWWWTHVQGKSVVICAVQKHETPYLNEWIDYHLALGFHKLYIYDNSPDFEVQAWKDRTFGNNNNGGGGDDRIVPVHFPGDKVQVPAYKACAKQVQRKGHTWALFIDIDEFLLLKKHFHVLDFAMDFAQQGTVGINWQIYGTAGRQIYEPLPVTYRFQCRLPDKYKSNIFVKSLVKVAEMVPERINDPHIFKGQNMYLTDGVAFNSSRIWGPRDTAVINHYYFRSHEEHLLKRSRGDVFFGGKIHVKEAQMGIDPHTKQVAPNGEFLDGTAWQILKNAYPERYASYEIVPQKEEMQCRQMIPRILHFVYVSPGVPNQRNEIPSSIRATIAEWKELHKDWEIQVWDNLSLHKEFPDLIPTLQQIKTMSWVANLVRYHVLERFGGIYLDTDIVGLRSLEPLRAKPAFTVCQDPFQKISDYSTSDLVIGHADCALACNAVIGAIPHHPALEETVKNSMANTHDTLQNRPNDPYSLYISGPYQWTKDFKKYSDVAILRSFTFYPCTWANKEDCVKEKHLPNEQVFAMHTWSGSWMKKS